MNKLYKIALVSSLSILSGVLVLNQVTIAQEDSSAPSQEIPSKERGRNMEEERITPPIRSRENPRIQRQNTENPAPQTRNRNSDTTEQTTNQRVNSQDDRLNTTQPIDRKDSRCQSYFSSRIKSHQNMFESKSRGRIAKYEQVVTRLENISTKLVEKGVDITNYSSYIAELKSKINSLNIANEEYLALLESNTNIETLCNDREQISSQMNIRKEKLQLVIAKDREIRIYIKDTIIPYLKSIKPQEQTTVPSTVESPVTSPTNSNQVLE